MDLVVLLCVVAVSASAGAPPDAHQRCAKSSRCCCNTAALSAVRRTNQTDAINPLMPRRRTLCYKQPPKALAATYALRAALAFFRRLDAELFLAPSDQPRLEDPDSVEPLQPRPSLEGPATKALTVVVPAYNEQERLPGTLEELLG